VAEERKTTIKQLAVDELAAFAGQLSLVIHSGLPVLDGLEIMRDDAANREEAAILDAMLAAYRETDSLSQAMTAAGVFPPYMIGMVHTGEVTGNLDRIMARLERHYQREGSLRSSVAQAVVYPVILSVMVTAVILILVMQVMPMFDQVFKELGTQMTGLPLVLARVGTALSGAGLALVVVVLVLAVLLLAAAKKDGGSDWLQALGRRLPGMKAIRHAEAASRLAAHMSLVLASGLTAEEGLDMAETISGDPDFARALASCRGRMREGADFSAALKQSGMFSGMDAQLIEMGSRTGTMDEALAKVADLLQQELDAQIDTRLARLEPALVIIMSVIVGGILLSVMVPLMRIMSAL
jgi:type IV pilus assembly protein PilC